MFALSTQVLHFASGLVSSISRGLIPVSPMTETLFEQRRRVFLFFRFFDCDGLVYEQTFCYYPVCKMGNALGNATEWKCRDSSEIARGHSVWSNDGDFGRVRVKPSQSLLLLLLLLLWTTSGLVSAVISQHRSSSLGNERSPARKLAFSLLVPVLMHSCVSSAPMPASRVLVAGAACCWLQEANVSRAGELKALSEAAGGFVHVDLKANLFCEWQEVWRFRCFVSLGSKGFESEHPSILTSDYRVRA